MSEEEQEPIPEEEPILDGPQSQQEQQAALIIELRALIERMAQEYDLTYESLYGCFTSTIIDLKLESKFGTPMSYTDDGEYVEFEMDEEDLDNYNDYEEYEEDDGDGWKDE